MLLLLRSARLAVRRLLLLDPTVHHRLNVVGGVVVVVVPGEADVVVVVVGDGDGGVIVGVVAAAIPIVAVPVVAAAQVRKRGGVHAVRARVVVGRVAGIVPRLETVETRIAVVRALVQDRGYGGDAGPRASFALLLPPSYLDHHCRLAPSGAWILKQGRQSQRVHPLVHALTAVGREVIRPHVRVFSFERELPVNLVLRFAHGNSVRWQQYRTQ